jgi:hypothetical protein
MGIGASIFLIAVGAILTWAVNVSTSGVNINTVGVILMVAGALGLLLSLVFWSSWGAWGPWRSRETIIREGGDPYYDRRP